MMDLLGDIGTNDQLIATRSENEVLKQTVTKLTQQVQDLTIQLTIAQAEIDIYRSISSSNDNPSTVTSNDAASSSAADIFQYNSETLIGINNNINNAMNYCHIPKHILSNLHENSNPICISMIVASSDDDDDNHSEHNLHTITIVTGGADSTLRWTRCSPNTIHHTTSNVNDTSPTTTTVVYDLLTAPVVCTTTITKEVKKYGDVVFQNTNTTLLDSYVVVGTMDGHVTLLHCSNENEDSRYQPEIVMDDSSSSSQLTEERVAVLKKHDKYVSSISWIYVDDDTTVHHPQESESCTSWLATSSADGTIHIYTVTAVSTADDVNHQLSSSSKVVRLKTRHIESFYFDNPVTCICYAKDITNNDIVLYVYVRNTPHIKVIRMPSSRPNTENSDTCCTISTVLHLNTSIYDTHVSFAVLDIKMSYDYKYLAVACDNHCHFIIENNCAFESQRGGRSNTTNTAPPSIQQAKIIRKLYGHVADSYSRPIVAWSCNNQYVYCNTQNDTTLCIYSIASGKLLDDHSSTQSDDHTIEHPPPSQQPHVRPIKHMCSHPYQNILVTTSFDHKTIVWTPQEQKEEVL